MERLKERSHLNGRSLRQEVKALLERAAETFTMREARRVSGRWRQNADRVGDPPIGWLDRARAGPGWLGHRRRSWGPRSPGPPGAESALEVAFIVPIRLAWDLVIR